jgi:type I restriction-modification system DNA methylase subunit
MPRPPKAKTAVEKSTTDFAWVQHFIYHLASQVILPSPMAAQQRSYQEGFLSRLEVHLINSMI